MILCTLHFYLHRMFSLPPLVRQVIFDRDIEIVICLLEVQESNFISDPHVNARAQLISHHTFIHLRRNIRPYEPEFHSLSNLASNHPPSDFAFPDLLLFPFYRLRTETYTSLVVFSRNQDRFPGCQQMVFVQPIRLSECALRNAIPKRERRNRVDCRIKKVQNIFWWLNMMGLLKSSLEH